MWGSLSLLLVPIRQRTSVLPDATSPFVRFVFHPAERSLLLTMRGTYQSISLFACCIVLYRVRICRAWHIKTDDEQQKRYNDANSNRDERQRVFLI